MIKTMTGSDRRKMLVISDRILCKQAKVTTPDEIISPASIYI